MSTRPSTSQTIVDFRQLVDRHLSLETILDLKYDISELRLSQSTASTVQANIEEKGQGEITYPDGGWRAWLTVIGVFIVQFSTFGYTNAYGVYQDFYVRIYLNEMSSSQISWIGSTQLFLILSMGLFTGRAFDKGYYYHLMFGGIALITFCLFMLSLCRPQQFYQVFLCQGLGLGIGHGLTYIPSISLISHYFRRHRTFALGIASAGSSMGGLAHPILLNHLLHGSVGFRRGVQISVALNLSLLVIAMILMRPRLPPANSNSILPKLRKFIRDPPYVAVVIGALCLLFGIYFPIFFFQLYAIKHGIDRRFAFFTVTIMNGGNLTGRILPNIVGNRFGVLNLTIISTASCAVLIFSMLFVHNVAGVVAFGGLFGFFAGAYISLLPPTVASISDDVSDIGARLGICLGIAGIAGLVGSPTAGALLTSKFVWWRPTLVAGVSTIVGTASLVIARHFVRKRSAEREKGLQTCVDLRGEVPTTAHLHLP